MSTGSDPVAIIGAGIGGLAAAIDLAARGVACVVLERAAAPGGKLRQVAIGDAQLDAGPTVFTMRWVFDELFERAGTRLDAHLALQPMATLARHAWSAGERLDLFTDIERSAQAIGELAGAAEARRFLGFCADARRIYQVLETPFLRGARCPTPLHLMARVGLRGLPGMFAIRPFSTMWSALGQHFHDPRLRQLFGRYATYCGSSPYQAPATLMLVAHVESDGVWMVAGGMHSLARTLQALAGRLGVEVRLGETVERVLVEGGRAVGVQLATGERIAARAVVANADAASMAAARLGAAVAHAVAPVRLADRSLSALTWNLRARTDGFPLLRHSVFFSRDYAAEFAQLRRALQLPTEPTVYVCAQDRADRDGNAPAGPERLLCLVNAPAVGDMRPFDAGEVEACAERTFALLARNGLHVERDPAATVVTTPADLERRFPGTGGALYGMASHGWRASFRRPGARTRLPGLYLAGGSTHPGPGVPMAALSGRQAAAAVLADLA